MNPRFDRRAQALETPPRWRRAWLWPFLLTLAFASTVAVWLYRSDAAEAEEAQRTMIEDALTLRERVEQWLNAETDAVNTLGHSLQAPVTESSLLNHETVIDGLRRLWISVTVLDNAGRLLAHVPQRSTRPVPAASDALLDPSSLSSHLVGSVGSGGQVIVRFDFDALLRKTVPWWLSRKYDVRLVDDYGQLIASNGDPVYDATHPSYRLIVESQSPDTYLELIARDARPPWWQSRLLGLVATFLLLGASASWALRRQMMAVDSARDRWHNEASWRQAIEESLTVGLRARDMQGRVVHVNKAFCDMVGFPPEQVVDRLPPMPYWLPDTLEDSMKRNARNLAGQAPREGYETQFRRGDGRIIDVMMFETPWVDASGQQIGWMGSMIDITASKQAQARERIQLDTLANQARLTMLGEVASALAHQLNQPLAAMAGYNAGVLRMLERRGEKDTMLFDALRHVGEQVEEAGRIVQRIRGFLTRRAPQREDCNIVVTLQRAIGLLRRDLKQKHVQLDTRHPPTLPPVWADPVLIEQVLINLMRNAADAMSGIKSGRIRVSATLDGDRYIRIDVDDSGPGLGGHTIEELTSPFYTSKAEGMGMGLSICRSIIEAHRGRIDVARSDELHGAQFTLWLPLNP